jgi:hypothetical protein
MLALHQMELQTHQPCGGYLPDVTAAEAEGKFRAEPPIRCHKCTARAQAIDAHLKSAHNPHPEALLWPVIPTS